MDPHLEYIPHTDRDRAEMLDAIGVASLEELFEAVPETVRLGRSLDIAPALDEITLAAHLTDLAARNRGAAGSTCFAGGGAYDHYVPAAARAVASRGEFTTSYTPYQPELSQGVLQAVFEFQTHVCELYGMEVANASLYDGASALVEAINLACRTTKREKVVLAGTIHPNYLAVVKTYTSGLGIELVTVPWNDNGILDPAQLDLDGAAAVAVQYPNFFGRLEDLRSISDAAHAAGALSIAVTDPVAMGVLASPGDLGADVAVGEGQAFGNSLSYGGPYVGLFATKLRYVRQVPGRIAGETLDRDGQRAYVLTLQAREQHIRRAKATSNVCTNQTLMAIAATIHLSWLGPQGLRRMGELCLSKANHAAARLAEVPGCELRFDGPVFKEFVLRTPVPARTLLPALGSQGFIAGPALGRWHGELDDSLLVAVTERRTKEEIDRFAEALEKELAGR